MWIPLSSHLLALGTSLLAHQDSVVRFPPSAVKSPSRQKGRLRNATHVGHIGFRQQQKTTQQVVHGVAARPTMQKAPELDVVLRLSDRQLEVPLVQ